MVAHSKISNITAKQIAEFDQKLARDDLRNEINQFKKRYGTNPQDLIAEKMEKYGIDADATLSTEQLTKISKEIVKEQEGLTQNQQLNMMKDFGEYGAAFLEKERTKNKIKELEIEERIYEQSHVNNINRSSGIGRELQY